MSDFDVLTTETVKRLRDAGPQDLVWLLADSHELLRAREAALRDALTARPNRYAADPVMRDWYERLDAALAASSPEGETPDCRVPHGPGCPRATPDGPCCMELASPEGER